jgi:hypothetical protein
MNRREFIASTGAAAVPLKGGCSPAAAVSGRRVLMKLGCQSAPTNETHLQYLARYGVLNICGYPEISDGRLYSTLDELKRMRDLAEKNRISIDLSFARIQSPRSLWSFTPNRYRRLQHRARDDQSERGFVPRPLGWPRAHQWATRRLGGS